MRRSAVRLKRPLPLTNGAWLIGLVALVGCADDPQAPSVADSAQRAPLLVQGASTSRVADWLTARLPTALQGQHDFPPFLVARQSDPVFPGNEQLALQVASNGALAAYVELPESQRTHDLYLHHPGDSYWESASAEGQEYARFKCEFLLHFAAVGDDDTSIAVYEVLPRVWRDSRFSLTRHHGPGTARSIERVPATLRDVRRMGELLGSLLQDFPH